MPEVEQASQEQAASDAAAKPAESEKPTQSAQPSQRPAADPNAGKEAVRDAAVLRDLQAERQKRQQLEARLKHFEQQYAERDQRLREAVIGERPEDTEAREIRERFYQLFPWARHFESPELIERMLGVAEQADSLQETTLASWTRHGRTMLDSVEAKIAEKVGGKLSDRQKKQIARYYVGEAETNPEILQRHENGDPTLVDEIASQIVEDWFEPARRSVTATEVERTNRRLPRGGDRSVGTTGKKKLDFKDEKAVADAMVESFRSNGGSFGE